MKIHLILLAAAAMTIHSIQAQTVRKYTTTESEPWCQSTLRLQSSPSASGVMLEIDPSAQGTELKAWGTTSSTGTRS